MDENQNPPQPPRPHEPGDQPPRSEHPGHANYGAEHPGAEHPGAEHPGTVPPPPPWGQPQGPRHTAVLPEGDPDRLGGPVQVPAAGAGTPKRKRSAGKLIGLIAVGAIALLVIVLAGSELFLRNRITSCIADQVKSASGATDVDVSLSKKPMLLQWAGGSAPSIDIDIPNLQGTEGMSAHLYLTDVQASGDNRIGKAVIVGTMSKDAIRTIANQSLQGASVTLKPDASQIDVTGKFFGLAETTLTLNVELVGDKVNVTATNTQVDVPFLGKMGIPDDLVTPMVTDLQDMSSQFPKGLQAQSLKLTDDGVNVTFAGTDVLPAELSNGTGDVGNGCSVL